MKETLREVYRVFRKGGRFMGTVPNDEVLSESIIICPGCGNRFHRWGHLQQADRNAIIEIMAYMNSNLSKKFSLMDLSADAYMSVSKFKYVFKSVVGQSFSEYMTQKRMEYACELLSYSNLYIGA